MIKRCFTSTETVGLLGTGSPGRPPRLSHSSWAMHAYAVEVLLYVQFGSVRLSCLMSSDVGWQIRDKLRPMPYDGLSLNMSTRHPRTWSPTSSWPMPWARFNNSLRPRKPEGSLGRTAQDGHLDSHTAPELSLFLLNRQCNARDAKKLGTDWTTRDASWGSKFVAIVTECQWPSGPCPFQIFLSSLHRRCWLRCVLRRDSKFSWLIGGLHWHVGRRRSTHVFLFRSVVAFVSYGSSK